MNDIFFAATAEIEIICPPEWGLASPKTHEAIMNVRRNYDYTSYCVYSRRTGHFKFQIVIVVNLNL